MRDLKLKFADFLFKYFFFLYQPLYFFYKKKRDLLEITYYKKYIKPGNVVLDIGGNIGFTTSIFSKLVEPNGKVISFEPDKTNFKHLSNLVKGKKLKNVDLVNKAVSINSKPTNIYLSNRLGVDHRTWRIATFLILIPFIFSCNKDEPFDESFYLHGGDIKVWKQESSFIIESGSQPLAQQLTTVRWIFRSNNIYRVYQTVPGMNENEGIWILKEDVLKIILGLGTTDYKVLLLSEDKLTLEHIQLGVLRRETWVPL